jgi:hypothetical protein
VSEIWTGVRERVEALAGRPDMASVFGASSHRFMLDAPLTQDQLVDWETRVGATLPTRYRSFLTEVASAGAGPYHGLLGFRVTEGIAHWVGDKWRGPERLDLRTAFPHRDEFQPEMWPNFDELPPPERFPTPADHAKAVRRRAELVQALDDRDEADTYGTIPLSHQGCGYYDLLVVNGPDAGHVWLDGRASDGPLSPHVDDTGRVTFDRWYLTWLARAEATCARHTTA